MKPPSDALSIAHYFVLSDGDQPIKIVFKSSDAIASKAVYIDCFDSGGNHLKAYQRDRITGIYNDKF